MIITNLFIINGNNVSKKERKKKVKNKILKRGKIEEKEKNLLALIQIKLIKLNINKKLK